MKNRGAPDEEVVTEPRAATRRHVRESWQATALGEYEAPPRSDVPAREGPGSTSAGAREGICEHGSSDSCKECGGSSICEHGRVRYSCKECGGSGICGTGGAKPVQGCGARASAAREDRQVQVRGCEHLQAREEEASARSAGLGHLPAREAATQLQGVWGSAFCEHGRGKRSARSAGREHLRAREGGDTSASAGAQHICEHGRVRAVQGVRGREHLRAWRRQSDTGSAGARRSAAREGASRCKECGGCQICEHGRSENARVRGGSICEHGRRRHEWGVRGGASASTGGCEVTARNAARLATRRLAVPPVHPKPEILVEPRRGGPGRGRRRARFALASLFRRYSHK